MFDFRLIGVALLIVLAVFGGTVAADESGPYDSWKFKFAGDERFRYEYKNDFDLKERTKDNVSWFYNRLRLNMKASYSDEYLQDKFVVFVEGLDARSANDRKNVKGDKAQRDDFDLHQGYVQAVNIAGLGVDLKLGRQEFKYGAGRLVAAPTWANRVRSFDGGVARYARNGFSSDILYGSDVKYDTEKFNLARNEEFLAGTYFSYQKNNVSPVFDWYYLNFVDIKGTTDTRRQTVGGRLKTLIASETTIDVEVPYQFGRQSGKDIRAYALHADVSRSFSSVMWKPKLALAYDQASGDKNSSDGKNTTFVPLYQSTHDSYGLLDIVRWQNIRDVALGVTSYPKNKLSFTGQADFLWLDNRHDAWYSSSGTTSRAATARDVSSYLGTELSLRSAYDLTANIKLEGGFAHLVPGEYLRDTSGGDDPINWFYTQLAMKF